jgi:hypothetical protein
MHARGVGMRSGPDSARTAVETATQSDAPESLAPSDRPYATDTPESAAFESAGLTETTPEPPATGWGDGYRPYLDGLRAVAVYLVVLFHDGSARFGGREAAPRDRHLSEGERRSGRSGARVAAPDEPSPTGAPRAAARGHAVVPSPGTGQGSRRGSGRGREPADASSTFDPRWLLSARSCQSTWSSTSGRWTNGARAEPFR